MNKGKRADLKRKKGLTLDKRKVMKKRKNVCKSVMGGDIPRKSKKWQVRTQKWLERDCPLVTWLS